MPRIEIRPAQPVDIPTLAEIDHGFKSSYVWQMDLVTEEGQLGVRFREIRLPRPVRVEYPRLYRRIGEDWQHRAVVLVGLLDDSPVGYISLSENLSPTTAWVTDLAVATDVRRNGIATALVFAGRDWAGQRGDRRMILEMQSKNLPGIRLAQKLGYEFCGYNDHYYSNQDIALFFAQHIRS